MLWTYGMRYSPRQWLHTLFNWNEPQSCSPSRHCNLIISYPYSCHRCAWNQLAIKVKTRLNRVDHQRSKLQHKIILNLDQWSYRVLLFKIIPKVNYIYTHETIRQNINININEFLSNRTSLKTGQQSKEIKNNYTKELYFNCFCFVLFY